MENLSLFGDEGSSEIKAKTPLADSIRPRKWDDFVGHKELIGSGAPLRQLVEGDFASSFILWGPPGSGKTTIARIIANITSSCFYEISAVNSGVSDVRKIISLAEKTLKTSGKPSILFIDEIHRFNKSQQDAILPCVENGTLRLIGATTENPSLEIIPALRSRSQIFRMEALSYNEMKMILLRAKENYLSDSVEGNIDEDALDFIVIRSNGDARKALNILEAAFYYAQYLNIESITTSVVERIAQSTTVLYDKGGNEHYDHASAFQKSLRGSDPDAAIYWLAKMIAGGEDPRFIARRLLVTASEDVGLADPMALVIANSAYAAVEKLGLPEARIPLAQAVIYVSRAPKDNSAIVAVDSALDDINNKGQSWPVPNHLKDTHYRDAKTRYGYGIEYKYPHDFPQGQIKQEYLPENLRGRKYVLKKTKNPLEETD